MNKSKVKIKVIVKIKNKVKVNLRVGLQIITQFNPHFVSFNTLNLSSNMILLDNIFEIKDTIRNNCFE